MFSVTLLDSTTTEVNVTGTKQKGAGYSNTIGCNHTVSISVINFIGRIYIEGSLASDPKESDWFPIQLIGPLDYVQYPQNPNAPTGSGGGDTGVSAYSFSGNYIWLRARVDRTYLVPPPTDPNLVGAVRYILLNYGSVSPASSNVGGNAPSMNGVPAGGALGQLLAKLSGANYDTGWVYQSQVFVSDTIPTNAREGDLWWDSTDGNLYVRYENTWVPSSSGIPGPNGPTGPTGAASTVVGPTGPTLTGPTGLGFTGPAGSTGPAGMQIKSFMIHYDSGGVISSIDNLPYGWSASFGAAHATITYIQPGLPQNFIAYGQIAVGSTIYTSRGPTALMNISYDLSIPGTFVLNNITANNVGTVYGGQARMAIFFS